MGHQQRERTRKRGLRDVLRKAPEVQRYLQAQMPKPTRKVIARELVRQHWAAFVGLAVAFVLAAAAYFKHWGA